jgi:hypothetical protein
VSLLALHVLQKVEVVVLDLEQFGIHALDGLGITGAVVVAHPNVPEGGARRRCRDGGARRRCQEPNWGNLIRRTDTLERWHLSSGTYHRRSRSDCGAGSAARVTASSRVVSMVMTSLHR